MCAPNRRLKRVQKFQGKFKDRFAIDENTGAFVMKSTAMASRFDMPRVEAEYSQIESFIVSNSNPRGYWNQERRLQSDVAELLGIGCKIKPTETLEEFVVRNQDRLVDNGVVKYSIF